MFISPTFYLQILRQQSFASKVQTLNVSTKKLCAQLTYVKAARRMLVKLMFISVPEKKPSFHLPLVQLLTFQLHLPEQDKIEHFIQSQARDTFETNTIRAYSNHTACFIDLGKLNLLKISLPWSKSVKLTVGQSGNWVVPSQAYKEQSLRNSFLARTELV